MKTALITGAGRGIGRALAVGLAKQGHTLFLVSRSKEALTKTKELCMKENAQVFAAVCDIREKDSVFGLKDKVLQTLGNVDLLIHCAAIGHENNFMDEPIENIRKIMDTNFFGAVYFTKALLPHMLEKSGQIVFVNSENLSAPRKTSYFASKAALSGFGESLAEELEGSTVKISNIYLEPVYTNLFKNLSEKGVASMMSKEDAAGKILSEIGLVEISQPEEQEKPGFFRRLFGR